MELTPILQIAKEILNEAGLKGMHVQDIAEAAVTRNKNLGLTVEVFKKKLQTALLNNLKLKSNKPSFAPVKWDKGPRKGKPKQGWYRTKIERIVPVQEKISIPSVSKGFIGKGGEYAVMSELLFWGYNASIMTVDDGIDIVASKDNKFFHIQVKTATSQNNKFLFTISQNSFNKYNTASVFYVFVLRNNLNNAYIIIPSGHIEYFINEKIITDTSVLSLTITADSKKCEYILNNKISVSSFYGKFSLIK